MAISGKARAVVLNATICAVIVVPTLAPKITPTDCTRVMSPALTNPTTSTVVTEEDWITAVTMAPVTAPIAGLPVSLANSVFIWFPAAAFNPSVIFSMPYRKSASPPSSSMVIVKGTSSVMGSLFQFDEKCGDPFSFPHQRPFHRAPALLGDLQLAVFAVQQPDQLMHEWRADPEATERDPVPCIGSTSWKATLTASRIPEKVTPDTVRHDVIPNPTQPVLAVSSGIVASLRPVLADLTERCSAIAPRGGAGGLESGRLSGPFGGRRGGASARAQRATTYPSGALPGAQDPGAAPVELTEDDQSPAIRCRQALK